MFVLADAMRAASLSMHGYPRNTSPVLDEFSRNGVLFKRHYANAPYTKLSISQFFTGMVAAPPLLAKQYSEELEQTIGDDVLILPGLLRAKGYRTILLSTHPWFNETASIREWFDETKVVYHQERKRAPFEDVMPALRGYLDGAAKDGVPFFLYVHLMDTHTPYRMHKEFSDHRGDGKSHKRYDKYDSEVRYTDYWFGQVLKELEKRELRDRTLIAFTSDHGEEFNELGPSWYNSSHGSNLRPAATHIPLLLQLPASHHLTGVFQDVTSHVDLGPTLAALAIPDAGLSAYRFDGSDLSERILGRTFQPTSREAFSEMSRYMSLRRGDLANTFFLFDRWSGSATVYSVRTDRYNYPVPEPREASGELAEIAAELEAIAREPSRRFRVLEKKPPLPTSKFIPVPAVAPLPDRRHPVYADQKDERWGIRPSRFLVARPNEDPGAITLRSRVAPGRYRIKIRLHKIGFDRKYRNRFKATVHGVRDKSVKVAPRKRARDKRPNIGVHRLAEELKVTISEARKGVAIAGFELEYLGKEKQAEQVPVDPELTERLRVLGYVE